MTWNTPKTDFAPNDLVTAAQLNAIGSNLQHLHDERWYNFTPHGYSSANEWISSVGRDAYDSDSMNIFWPGAHIDTADAEVYFWGIFGPSNAAATACARLYDRDAAACITNSWIESSGSTSPGTMACPILSSDISGNMPSGNVNISVQHRQTAGCQVRFAGYGIFVTA